MNEDLVIDLGDVKVETQGTFPVGCDLDDPDNGLFVRPPIDCS